VFSVLRFTDSDYPFGIFKLFLSLLKPLSIKQHNKKLISIKNVFEDALAQTPQPIEDGIKAAEITVKNTFGRFKI
jgi:hypothetical protein